jgi:hypothetical protein
LIGGHVVPEEHAESRAAERGCAQANPPLRLDLGCEAIER